MPSPSRSGVFRDEVDRRVEVFTESVSFDQRLLPHDIAASIAHAQMLREKGMLSDQECQQLVSALSEIGDQLQRGTFPLSPQLEDIHMNIEHALIERLGDVGRKLHTARSRNDQVSTDLRMWVRQAIDQTDARLAELQRAFLDRCQTDEGVLVPGYTHMQRAQPVLAAHYWLAYCEKLQRDRQRLEDCRRRVNVCPLGTAALAGTGLNIDRQRTAAQLGFQDVTGNSLDSSGDRDFVLETVFCWSVIAVHLSGWAEEWILWATDEFGFLQLPDAFCTGSSIMPQKRNPDCLELVRGKTGRVVGALQSLLVMLKGIPLAYQRDLQEDKQPLFDAADTILACLGIAVPIVQQSKLNRETIAATLDRGYLDATSLMELLISRGMPQRQAHHRVGQLVSLARERGVPLAGLSLEEFQRIDPALDSSVYDVLGPQNAVRVLHSHGSSSPSRVSEQVLQWQRRLAR